MNHEVVDELSLTTLEEGVKISDKALEAVIDERGLHLGCKAPVEVMLIDD